MTDERRALVREALAMLGKRRLVLSIHAASFPSLAEEDFGRGVAGGRGGSALLAFAQALGFDAIQLGPSGETQREDASPYASTFFARDTVSVDFFGLGRDPEWAALVDVALLERVVAENPARETARCAHAYAHAASRAVFDAMHARFLAERGTTRGRAIAETMNARSKRHGEWAARERIALGLDEPEERHALAQLVASESHDAFRRAAHALGLAVFGDLAVGSPTARAIAGDLFLDDYLLGAPPSRTNPDGQPWGYPVLDPRLYGERGDGRAAVFLRERIAVLLDAHDGMRIDHPHGLVCPWVYRRDAPDAMAAVARGARLFDSPDDEDHPDLAAHAIARPDQIDRAARPYADERVRALDDAQVARYALLLDAIVDELKKRDLDVRDLACEVLSTIPYPLARVLERHHLGRFRVTQKARLDDPADPYSTVSADPLDWVMVGTHDTPPIWRVARGWDESTRRDRAARFAARLASDPGARESLARDFASDVGALVHAEIADLFACPAAHVVVFFADLFGLEEIYNRPGTFSPENWALRLTPDFRERWMRDASAKSALDPARAVALALRARAGVLGTRATTLADRLEAHGR